MVSPPSSPAAHRLWSHRPDRRTGSVTVPRPTRHDSEFGHYRRAIHQLCVTSSCRMSPEADTPPKDVLGIPLTGEGGWRWLFVSLRSLPSEVLVLTISSGYRSHPRCGSRTGHVSCAGPGRSRSTELTIRVHQSFSSRVSEIRSHAWPRRRRKEDHYQDLLVATLNVCHDHKKLTSFTARQGLLSRIH